MEEIPNLNLNWLKYPFKMGKIPNLKFFYILHKQFAYGF